MIDYIFAPLIVLLVGTALMIYPPPVRLNKYGYRSKEARKSPAKWKAAQQLAGRSFMLAGIISLIISLGLFFRWPSDLNRFLALFVTIICVLLAVLFIEKRLKKTGENGGIT